jgi:thioredoxin 2
MGAQIVSCPSCGKRNRVPRSSSGVPRCGVCHAPLPWLVEADEGSFDEIVRTARLLVLVDIWAPWCGPCRMVSPIVERMAREAAGRLQVVKVNADEAPGVASRFRVQGIPTLLLLRDGKEVARQVGALPEADLRAWLAPHLEPAGAA